MDRDTLALYQKMFNVTPRSATRSSACWPRTRARRSARWATTRRCRCCRTQVRSLYDYFRQQFAQVTNPPIDPLREIDRHVAADADRAGVQHLRARARSMRARSCSARRSCRSASCARSWRSKEVTHEFIDLQYDPAEGLKAAHRAHVRAGRERGARGQARAAAVGSLPGARASMPGARAARHRRRASSPGEDRACAASATCWSRPAPRAIRITSPA